MPSAESIEGTQSRWFSLSRTGKGEINKVMPKVTDPGNSTSTKSRIRTMFSWLGFRSKLSPSYLQSVKELPDGNDHKGFKPLKLEGIDGIADDFSKEVTEGLDSVFNNRDNLKLQVIHEETQKKLLQEYLSRRKRADLSSDSSSDRSSDSSRVSSGEWFFNLDDAKAIANTTTLGEGDNIIRNNRPEPIIEEE